MSSSMQSQVRPLVIAMVLALFALSACSGGGGSGGGGSSSGGGSNVGAVGDSGIVEEVTVEARLAWNASSGPVAAYRVYVSRNDSDAILEATVSRPEVVITGEPGERVRISVRAISRSGDVGPLSPPSPTLLFTEQGVTLAVVASESSSTATATPREANEDVAGTPSEEPMALVLAGDKTRGDFDGDGAADLLWEAPEPGVELRIASLSDATIVRFDRPEGSWWVVGTGDLDGDGLTDILWQSAEGVVAYTPLSSLLESAPEALLVLLGTLDLDEAIVSIGDFRGDGSADLLTVDEVGGSYELWLRDEAGATERVPLEASTEDGSQVVATGDYDGDGRTDVLWRTAEGALEATFMDGAFAEARSVVVDTVSTPFVADGDFDADGSVDLAVRNAAGNVEILLLRDRGAAIAWDRLVDAGSGAGWQPGAPGDYDGDGSADLVWTSDADRIVRTHPTSGAGLVDVAIHPDGAWVLLGDLP